MRGSTRIKDARSPNFTERKARARARTSLVFSFDKIGTTARRRRRSLRDP